MAQSVPHVAMRRMVENIGLQQRKLAESGNGWG